MEFQLSYFKSWKMLLLKCCTHYANKFGKLSSGHRTGKGQFSFQPQRKAMPKNVQIIVQLYTFKMPARYAQNPSSLGFSSMGIENFQKYKLDLEKAGTWDQIANICWITEKAREFQKNIYFCSTDYDKAFDCVDHNKLWNTVNEMGIPDHLTCLLRTCMQDKRKQN